MSWQQEVTFTGVRLTDAQALLQIYAYYVQNTAITFEYEVPSLDTFQTRIEQTLEKYPFIVARRQNEIVGYAYSGAFHSRAAYEHCAEVSIYLKPDVQKMGVGRSLYTILEKVSQAQHITNLYACIAYANTEDEYLTNNSFYFHQHLGYQLCGHFAQCGYKFERWYDMVWMEKMIGAHASPSAAVIAWPQLSWPELNACGLKQEAD